MGAYSMGKVTVLRKYPAAHALTAAEDKSASYSVRDYLGG